MSKWYLNHLALRAHLYLKAGRITFDELQILKVTQHQLVSLAKTLYKKES